MKIQALPGSGVSIPARLRRFAFLLLCFTGPLTAAPPAPRADFFRHEYGPLLPEVPEAALFNYAGLKGAASTGDGGWLTFWTQLGAPAPGINQSHRLMVRLLPPGRSGPWEGNALPALDLAKVDNQTVNAILGEGGAWLAWISGAEVQVARFEQATGAQNGPLLHWPAQTQISEILAAGSGQDAWVLDGIPGASALTVRVLGKTGGIPVVKTVTALTEFPASGLSQPSIAAGAGRCLISAVDRKIDSLSVRTMSVDRNGQASQPRELILPAGSHWLGATGSGNGFTGFWSVPYPYPLPQLIYARPINFDGSWHESAALLLAPLDTAGVTPTLIAGQNRAVIRGGLSGSYYWTGGDSFQLVGGGIHPTAIGAESFLAVTLEDDYVVRASQFPDFSTGTATTFSFPLSQAAGYQTAPNLAWTPSGLQVVCQLRYYRVPGASLPGTGVSLTAGAASGPQSLLYHPGFYSPAQAWQGDLQLIAYRKDNATISNIYNSNDIDDVMGVLSRTALDGTVSIVRQPFVIGGGTGSQRGVSVARLDDGFIAAWREEIPSIAGSTALFLIRAAYISPTGDVQPPGGRLIDIGVGELSAVFVADGGAMVWRAPQNINQEEPSMARAAFFQRNGPPSYDNNLSPLTHNAVAPQVLSDNSLTTFAWRDKNSKRIFVTHYNNYLPPVAISPAGERAREPVLASLGNQRTAVLWIEETGNPLIYNIWMALTDLSGVSDRVLVASGWLDKDILTAKGDGKGRVAIAYNQYEAGTNRLKVLLIAPEVSQNGGLKITPVAGSVPGSNRFLVSWEPSDIFPAKIATAENSGDLKNWLSSGEVPMVSDGPGRMGWPIAEPGSRSRFYRLRPVMVPGL